MAFSLFEGGKNQRRRRSLKIQSEWDCIFLIIWDFFNRRQRRERKSSPDPSVLEFSSLSAISLVSCYFIEQDRAQMRRRK
jgi:hypothetical protein